MKQYRLPKRSISILASLIALTNVCASQALLPPSWDTFQDADQDGMTDIDEILWNMDPLDPADGNSDLDGDQLSFAWEYALGTDPALADTDKDGWSDSDELLLYGTDPLSAASFPLTYPSQKSTDTATDSPASTDAEPSPTVPPPPPSLANGDFTDVSITAWKSMLGSKQYQNKGFVWGAGAVASWSAYVGSTVEVWDSGGEKFIELDGSQGNYGIKQAIANAKAGAYILAWKQSGRNSAKAEADPYLVKVYYMNGTAEVPIGQSAEFTNLNKLAWTDNAFGFQITPEQLAAAGNNPIYVAFLPTGSLNTYGSLIDKVSLHPLEIKEVISDQIAGNEANKLPTAFYGKQPNNPMLMATRTGKDARLQIVVDIPATYAADLRVGVRVVDNPTVILGSAASLPGGAKIPLAFTAVDGKKLYEVVIGYDKNHDSILADNEVIDTFDKTPRTDPGGGAYTGDDTTFAFLDKILIVTLNDFTAARAEAEDFATSIQHRVPFPLGSDLLRAFTVGGTVIQGANLPVGGFVVDASVIPSPLGLSHPLGRKWDAANQAITHKIVYPTTSAMAEEVVASDELSSLIGRTIFANKSALSATATTSLQTSAPIAFADNQVAFASDFLPNDMHLALGKCNAEGYLIIKYRSAPSGKIAVAEVNCYGSIKDLYDWAFGIDLRPFGIRVNMPKQAARTQAGNATLAAGTWPDAGRIFFTQVEFGTGWRGWGNIEY